MHLYSMLYEVNAKVGVHFPQCRLFLQHPEDMTAIMQLSLDVLSDDAYLMRWTLKRVKHGSDGSNTATEILCTKELMVTASLCSNFTCFFFSFCDRIKASHVE